LADGSWTAWLRVTHSCWVCVVIFSAHSWRSGFSPDALWIAYSAAIVYGTAFRLDVICLNTSTGHFLWTSSIPKAERNAADHRSHFFAPLRAPGRGKCFDTYHSYKLAFELNSPGCGGRHFCSFLRQNAGATGNEDYRE